MLYYDILEEIRILQDKLSEMENVPDDHPDLLRHDKLLCSLPLCSIPGGHLLRYHKEMKERYAERVDEAKRDLSSLESSILRSIATEKDGGYMAPAHASGIVQVAFSEYQKKLDQKADSVG